MFKPGKASILSIVGWHNFRMVVLQGLWFVTSYTFVVWHPFQVKSKSGTEEMEVESVKFVAYVVCVKPKFWVLYRNMLTIKPLNSLNFISTLLMLSKNDFRLVLCCDRLLYSVFCLGSYLIILQKSNYSPDDY